MLAMCHRVCLEDFLEEACTAVRHPRLPKLYEHDADM